MEAEARGCARDQIGAAKHLALDELEAIDVPLNGAIAPRILECGDNLGFIAQ